MDLCLSRVLQIEAGAVLDASPHAGAPAELGHRAVAQLELTLARVLLESEATVMERAIEELWTRLEVCKALGRESHRSRLTLV